jgi:type VI secretion system secreted protein VgrG
VDNALLSFFRQDKDLVTENRPLRLRLAHPTQMLEDVLLPQRVQGSESICGSIEYRILCVSLDAFIPLKELIALPVAVDIVTDRGELRSICGIVTEARAGDSDGGLASYQLVLRDALSIMEKRNNTRVFRNKNEVEIVQVILDEWLRTNPVIGTCFRYEMDESFRIDAYPQREFTMQYNESDAAFIRRLLKRRGIAWYFRADQSNWPSHTMVMFDNADTLPPNAAGVVRYHRDAATEERDTITSWCAVRTLQPGSVSRFSWNYKNPKDSEFMTAMVDGRSDQGPNGNEISATLDDYLVLPPHAGHDHQDLNRLGQLAMNRHDLESKCFHGEGSVRDFRVGEYFELEGHPEIDGHENDGRAFVITALTTEMSNNLSKGLTERVERLFSRSRWVPVFEDRSSARNVKVGFTAVRRGIPIVPAYDVHSELPNVPMQSAIVVGPAGEEVHCDELGRVKIRFRATREKDHEHAQQAGAADNDVDSGWVRVSTNWAGDGPGKINQCGALSLPRIGSEVLVSFLSGDPDKPVIVGQLFNQSGQPPALDGVNPLPGNRYVSGIRSKENRGHGANSLWFDDTSGEIGVQLSSDHAKSQLNLGHIVAARVKGTASSRGEGAELRSEESVAIRGSKGVLLSAEGCDDGDVLARDGLIGMVEVLASIAAQLSELNAVHSKDQAGTAHLNDLLERIRNWSSAGESTYGKSLLAGTSNDGIVLVTPSSIEVGGQEHVGLMSSKDVDICAAGSARAMAMNGMTLFSRNGGMKVISANGTTQIQSQDGDIEIVASGSVRISAGQGIELLAPEIKLASQGTQTNYGASQIVHQCKGSLVIKSSKFEHTQGGSGVDNRMDFPSTDVQTDERIYLVSSQSGEPIPDRKYKLELPDGRVIEGISDQEGKTALAAFDQIGELKVTVFPSEGSQAAVGTS